MKPILSKRMITYVIGLTMLLTIIDVTFLESTLPIYLIFLSYFIGTFAGAWIYFFISSRNKSSIDYEGH